MNRSPRPRKLRTTRSGSPSIFSGTTSSRAATGSLTPFKETDRPGSIAVANPCGERDAKSSRQKGGWRRVGAEIPTTSIEREGCPTRPSRRSRGTAPFCESQDRPAVTDLRGGEHGEVAGSGQSLRSDSRIWPGRPGPERVSIRTRARTRPDRRSRAGRLKPRSTVQDAAQAKARRGGREPTGSELFVRAGERQGETRAQQRLRQRRRREGAVRTAANLSPALARVRLDPVGTKRSRPWRSLMARSWAPTDPGPPASATRCGCCCGGRRCASGGVWTRFARERQCSMRSVTLVARRRSQYWSSAWRHTSTICRSALSWRARRSPPACRPRRLEPSERPHGSTRPPAGRRPAGRASGRRSAPASPRPGR